MLTSDVPSNTADAIPQTSVQHAGAGRRAAEEVDATGFWEFKKKNLAGKEGQLRQLFFQAAVCAREEGVDRSGHRRRQPQTWQ